MSVYIRQGQMSTVLEWQVVTGVGTLVTATPTQNPDLFWALSGGGGGTYGIVLSATVKFHPTVTSIFSAILQFAPPITTEGVAAYWQTIKTFLQLLPLMVNSGLQISFPHSTKPRFLTLTHPGILLIPTILQYYNSANFGANVFNANTAGRLLPRSVVQNDTDSFISILQTIADNGFLMAGVTLEVNKTVVPNAPEISLNPYWRKTLMNAVFGTYLNYTNFPANFQSQNFMTNTIGPALAALTPDRVVYLKEADFQQPDWKREFYGANYDRLDAVKAKYDQLDIFYALGAVGSDRWVERKDGHFCEA
ncbi:hypothetical protein BGAL_0114g00020 [Botrytis galanthina]|uniref:Berberine/berberine-like domain-containing protein n=1 Tax=Botrytis galanthina TaxID=278940 RepID=A0A4S8R1T7_9HELO|nr:hypothetical protein BGAL_0114g00020 [Botrytis galanthina]